MERMIPYQDYLLQIEGVLNGGDHLLAGLNATITSHAGLQNSGMGWIIRSSNGIFLHSGYGKFEGRQTILEA